MSNRDQYTKSSTFESADRTGQLPLPPSSSKQKKRRGPIPLPKSGTAGLRGSDNSFQEDLKRENDDKKKEMSLPMRAKRKDGNSNPEFTSPMLRGDMQVNFSKSEISVSMVPLNILQSAFLGDESADASSEIAVINRSSRRQRGDSAGFSRPREIESQKIYAVEKDALRYHDNQVYDMKRQVPGRLTSDNERTLGRKTSSCPNISHQSIQESESVEENVFVERVDSFHLRYAPDSTDSDTSSDSNDGQLDPDQNTVKNEHLKDKKEKNRNIGRKKKQAGGNGALTERQRSVARYRATIERIDRKMRKHGFGEEVKCVNDVDENETIRFLLSGRVFGYPGSDGSILSNYLSFLKQKHPLLSLFLHHRLHPFKSRRRLVVFCCSLFFAFIMSVILLEGFYFDEEFICAGGCGSKPEGVNNTTSVDNGSDSRKCYGGVNDGMDYGTRLNYVAALSFIKYLSDKYHGHCQYYPPWAISFIAGSLIVPYDMLLKFLATCGCVQGRSFFQENCLGIHCRGAVISIGDCLFAIFVGINILCTLAALYRAYFVLKLGVVLRTFILSEIISFGYWIVWTMPYFAFKYPTDRKQFYKDLRKKRKKEWRKNHPGEKMTSFDEINLFEDQDNSLP